VTGRFDGPRGVYDDRVTVAAASPIQIATPDGRSLDVYLAGPADGDMLVFHSGTPSVPLPYPPMIDLMTEHGLRYVGFSRPGYGSSTRRPGRSVADVVDDTTTVLDHLGADRTFVIGWSGGGPHALACAALLPDRVRAAATIAGVAPYPAEGLDYLDGMGAENIEEFQAALDGPDRLIEFKERNWPIFRTVTADQVATSFGDLIDHVDAGSLTGDFAEFVAACFREALRESYWGWFDDDMAFVKPWGFEVESILVPVHVWQGGHDRMVPFAHGQWCASHIPTAIPHVDPENGHLRIVVQEMGTILDELIESSPG
jgi:pimeloyl-ACP methyl ester carboxylesterase